MNIKLEISISFNAEHPENIALISVTSLVTKLETSNSAKLEQFLNIFDIVVTDLVLRLDRVMADRKMSLNELAEKVGVSNVNLSKMKTGKISAIRFSTLEAICEALNCQPGDILEYEK